MNIRLVLRLIRHCNRIRRREKLYKYKSKQKMLIQLFKRYEKPLGFLLRIFEFILKLLSLIIGFSHKTYINTSQLVLIQSHKVSPIDAINKRDCHTT